ncbi:MAG: hypothetical protein LBI30_00035 [Holosporales bacterium]|jgi:glucose-6-phosphate isomerase|nr:hypothetical protein [Holosporales bacterium]
MLKIDSKSLFAFGEDCSLIKENLRFRLNEGLPSGLKVLSCVNDNISLARNIAERIGKVRRVVILATGGSSLGGQAVCALSRCRDQLQAPTIEFWENIDPRTIKSSLDSVDFNDAAFISISKSGETSEILAQTAIVINKFMFSKYAKLLSERMFVVTQSNQSSLSVLAGKYGICVFPHPDNIGGRFSVFSIVGILPTVIAGLDAFALCEGAKDVIDSLRAQDSSGQPFSTSICATAKKLLSTERPVNAFVLMYYGDGLSLFARWFAQLWAESLGKRGFGLIPVIACGTVDQHSQLQLYLDGPNDKLFTFVGIGGASFEGKELRISGLPDKISAKYLEGRGLNELFNAERDTTIEVLAQEGRDVRYMEIPNLNERALGQLMAYFMLEVVITADMMKVDAFDQPAVEKSKRLLKSKLSVECQ